MLMVVDRSDSHTTMTDTGRWAMLIYHLVTNLKRKISKCSYWDDWSLWGRGNIEFIHLLHRPSTFQHSETPELRESTHEVDQGVEDILIVDPRFFLHKTHGRRYLKVYWEMGHKNEANTQWLFMLHKHPSTSFPEFQKDSHFTESICY